MIQLALSLVIFTLVLWFFIYQLRLYSSTPHDDNDAVIYVERGCRCQSSLWRGFHYDTVIITKQELILNDVLTFYGGYRFSKPSIHVVKQPDILLTVKGTFKITPLSLSTNLKICFLDANGTEQNFCIQTRDPSAILRLLANA